MVVLWLASKLAGPLLKTAAVGAVAWIGLSAVDVQLMDVIACVGVLPDLPLIGQIGGTCPV